MEFSDLGKIKCHLISAESRNAGNGEQILFNIADARRFSSETERTLAVDKFTKQTAIGKNGVIVWR